MSITAEEVIVQLEARNAQFRADIARAETHFEHSMRGIRGAATATEARVASAFRSMATAAGITVGAAGIVAGTRAFLGYADAAKTLEAQLRLATAQSGSFAQAQEDVRRIATETRTGIEETASLYATFQRNARELGISQEQAARATQTVSEAFQISGASAAEAAGGLRQFLQGVQSGTLRGEELNSVLENAPRLARLIADSLGVTIGQLRAMGQEGQLAGDKLIRALTDRRFTEQIDAEFRELPVTFDQAMTLVNNAAVAVFGAFDRGGQFSNAIAHFFGESTDGFGEMEDDAEQAGIIIRSVFEGLQDMFEPMVGGADGAFSTIVGMAQQVRNSIRSIAYEFQALLNNTANVGEGIVNFLDPGLARRMFGPQSQRGNRQFRFADRLSGRMEDAELDLQLDAVERRNRAGGYQRSGGAFLSYRPVQGGGNGAPAPPRVRSGAGGGGRRRGGAGPSAETVARRAEADRVRELRDTQSFQDELARLNEDLIQARQAMVTAAEALAAFEVQEVEARRDRRNAGFLSDAEEEPESRRELARVRAQQLVEANNAVAAQQIANINAREAQRVAEEQNRLAQVDLENAIDVGQANADLAQTTEDRRAAALRLLDLQQQLERLELEGIAGAEGVNDLRRREAQARLEMLDTIYQARRQGVLDQTMGPGAAYLRDIRAVGAGMGEQFERVAVTGFERLNSELAEAAAGFLNLGGVAGRVLDQILADIMRIAIQQAIIAPLAEALLGGGGGGKGGGGLGGAIAAGIGAIFGGPRALGGPVAAGKAYLVGENGRPELFVPGQSGTIVPMAKALGGYSGTAIPAAAPSIRHFHISVDAKNSVTPAGFAEQISRTVLRLADKMDSAREQRTLRQVPGRLARFEVDGM